MQKKFALAALALIVTIAVSARCQNEQPRQAKSQTDKPLIKEDTLSQFVISTSAFAEGEPVPVKHTCDGQDVSPALKWTAPPESTKSLALICDDPDAPGGTWVHWVVYDLPPDTRSLPEGVPNAGELDNGARQGRNDFPRIGYDGPCPPPGPTHRYFFKLYALDTKLGLKSGATKVDVEKVIKGHILGEARLVGLYKR